MTKSRIKQFSILQKYIFGISASFVVAIALGISFSNMNALGASSHNLIGQSRSIRSDEWLRSSPMALSLKVAKHNNNQFSALSVSGQPGGFSAFNIINIDDWLARKLPVDQYFSYVNLSGMFLLLIFLPLLLSRFGLRQGISIIGTFIILLSPGDVWWSFGIANILGRFCAGALFLLCSVDESKGLLKRIFFSIGAGWILSTLFFLYQPWVICCFIVFGPLGVKILVEARKQWLLIFSAFCVTSVLIAWQLLSNWHTYAILRQTVYPGIRSSIGGLPNAFDWMFSGPLDIALLTHVVTNGTNQSEISLGFAILLIPGLALVFRRRIQKGNISGLLVLTGIAILIFWTAFPIPKLPGNILSLVPPQRAMTFWTVAAPFVLLFAMADVDSDLFSSKYEISKRGKVGDIARSVLPKSTRLCLSALAFTFTFGSSTLFRTEIVPSFNPINVIISLIVGLSIWLILGGFKNSNYGLGLFFLIALLTSAAVNPIVLGTSQYFDNDLSRIFKTQNNEHVWVSDSMFTDAYSIANGIESLSGQQYFGPNLDKWSILDPLLKSKKYWNRGAAYVVFDFNANSKSPIISSPQDDIISVSINPCAPDLRSLGVDRIISSRNLTGLSCLTLIAQPTSPSKLYIFKLQLPNG